MSRRNLVAVIATALLAFAADNVQGQICGHGCGYGNSRGFLGGFYANNCGRGFTQNEAAGLWANYCNEDCGFQGGCGGYGCGLFRGLKNRFGGGCGCFNNGCDSSAFVGGCGTDGGYVGGCGVDGPVTPGCGVDSAPAGFAPVAHSGGCGCGLLRGLRGLFGRCRGGHAGLIGGCNQGCGCCCYQGCFGYPRGGGGYGQTCGGHLSCGQPMGCRGCRCRLFGKVFGVAGTAKSAAGCAIRGVGKLTCGLKNRLFRCGCLGRIGRTGCDGGYFYDAPFSTSHNFGYYAAGSGNCDSGTINANFPVLSQPALSQPVYSQPALSQPAYSQPTPMASGACNASSCNIPTMNNYANPNMNSTPMGTGTPPVSSFSPAGEVIPGQVLSDSINPGGGN